MKKLLAFAVAVALAVPVLAQEEEETIATVDSSEGRIETVENEGMVIDSAVWPAFFALAELPETPDLVGLRLTIPFSTKQENVTGVDIGLWGRCRYFEGIQLNVLRNDVKDSFGGLQAGLYNSVGRGDLFGLQIGLWNEAASFRGVQLGLVNLSGDSQGFQIGLINRSESLYGFQFGLINVIRDAEVPVFPVFNIGF